jgi:hypothetical protein
MLARIATVWLVLLLAAHGHAQVRGMKLQKVEYLVAELPEHPQLLTITGGAMRYESHSNSHRPGSLGIGVYERPLASGELEAIESRLNPSVLQSLKDHRGQVLSGDRSRRIRLTSDTGTIEKLVGTKLPVDPALQKTIDWLDTLVDDVSRYPRRVLQMTVQDAALSRDGAFSATLILSSSGDQQVRFRPPRAAPAAQDDVLALFWWPHAAGAPKGDVQRAPVTAQAVPARTRDGLGTFLVRSRLEGLSAGSVAVQILYLNMTPKLDGGDVPVGELLTDPIVLH